MYQFNFAAPRQTQEALQQLRAPAGYAAVANGLQGLQQPVAQLPGQHGTTAQAPVVQAQPQSNKTKQNIAPKPPQAGAMAGQPGAPGGPVKTAEAAPAAKRKKKKPENKVALEKIKRLIPQSVIYSELLEYEHKIDALFQRKRADIHELLAEPRTVPKKLRIYVFNTHEHQDAVEGSPDVAGWVLNIHGRVVDPCDNESTSPHPTATPTAATAAAASTVDSPSTSRHVKPHPFTYYVNKLRVELDPQQYRDGSGVIEWKRQDNTRAFMDSFQIRRAGRSNVNVKITLEIYSEIQKFRLSPWLSAFCETGSQTRSGVLHKLWGYISAKKLLNPQQPHVIDCDSQLKALFKADQVELSSVSERLMGHMQLPEPIHCQYTVRVDGSSPSAPDCYDVDIETQDPISLEALPPFLQKIGKDRDLEQLDIRLNVLTRKLNEHFRRRSFYLGISQSPVEFVNTLIASQSQDLRVAKTGGFQQYEATRRSEFYKGKWVEDAVLRYLHRRIASGS